ncbi:MAG: hypothetical protein ACOC22_02945 [bacterium]
MIYTGIGTREIPDNIQSLMIKISFGLAKKGFTLRSGGANGSDSAFELGCDKFGGNKEIFLPWKGFNDNNSGLYLPYRINDCHPKAKELAEKFHPSWYNLSFGAKKLMIRNSHQVFGWDMDTPSDFIIAYTKDGKFSGGTGQALRISDYYNIKIYNLYDKNSIMEFTERFKIF